MSRNKNKSNPPWDKYIKNYPHKAKSKQPANQPPKLRPTPSKEKAPKNQIKANFKVVIQRAKEECQWDFRTRLMMMTVVGELKEKTIERMTPDSNSRRPIKWPRTKTKKIPKERRTSDSKMAE